MKAKKITVRIWRSKVYKKVDDDDDDDDDEWCLWYVRPAKGV